MTALGVGPTIVVGVSGRSGSPAALRWATDVAERVDGRVRAVLAWRPPRPPAAPGMHPPAVSSTGAGDPEQDAKERLDRFVSAAVGANAMVECVVERGSPATVLVRHSRAADLLVIDSPRRQKLANVSAKLLAPQLVYRSDCPVVVMPAAHAPGRAGGGGLRRAASRVTGALVDSAGRAGRAGWPPVPPPPEPAG